MAGYAVEVQGADSIAAGLDSVANDLDNLTSAQTAAGQTVRIRASQLAPSNTGTLSRSINASVNGPEVSVGTPVSYAPFQEYGTVVVPASPYLRPALEASTGQIVELYAGEIQKDLATVKGA